MLLPGYQFALLKCSGRSSNLRTLWPFPCSAFIFSLFSVNFSAICVLRQNSLNFYWLDYSLHHFPAFQLFFFPASHFTFSSTPFYTHSFSNFHIGLLQITSDFLVLGGNFMWLHAFLRGIVKSSLHSGFLPDFYCNHQGCLLFSAKIFQDWAIFSSFNVDSSSGCCSLNGEKYFFSKNISS